MPGCQSVVTIGPDAKTPDGWVYFVHWYGLDKDGMPRRDFCSIHSRMTLAQIAESMGA
jgi:hypothetical protein